MNRVVAHPAIGYDGMCGKHGTLPSRTGDQAMTEQETIQNLADKYRSQGYTVILDPRSSPELPSFLRDAGIDLIALKNDEIITVQAKSVGSAQPLILAAEYDAQYGLSLLAEAERLLTPETIRSALLISWAAFEGIARVLLNRIDPNRSPPGALLWELKYSGQIDQGEHKMLVECNFTRSAIAHGVRPASVAPDQVLLLVGLCRRLAQTPRTGNVGLQDSVSLTLMRGKVNQDGHIRKMVEQADVVLREVLGKNRGSATVEWDRAEDASGRSVITLTLSDFTGSVTGTFAPDELESKAHLRGRLYRLWGDLLSFRARQASEQLLEKAGT